MSAISLQACKMLRDNVVRSDDKTGTRKQMTCDNMSLWLQYLQTLTDLGS